MRIGISTAVLALVGGCVLEAQNPIEPAPVTSGVTTSVTAGSGVDAKAYIIGAEDVLRVDVWREPGNSGVFVVRPDGKISLPLIGEVQAAGITPLQLSKSIATGLERLLTHPEVTVGVERVNSKKYYIQGEINRPGAYPLVVPTTVLEALVNAGGFRDFANAKKIIVLRGSERLKFNYHEVTRGKKMEQNIPLQNGDQIIVP